jgi:hypothetical protein
MTALRRHLFAVTWTILSVQALGVVLGAVDRPTLSVQFTIENVTNHVYLLSKESSMVQGQYSIPRLISASVRRRC